MIQISHSNFMPRLTYMHVFLGYYLAIQLLLKLLSIKCDDRLLDDFYYGHFMLEPEDLTII